MQERTPRDIAKDFIRRYVERGDSVESLATGEMGRAGADYWAQIGGSVYHPTDRERPLKLRRQELAITRVAREPCLHRFSLAELHAEIRAEQEGGSTRPTQPRLF